MGVYGLWRLLDAAGKQVPLETLEGKVLAIDISIWIHQVLQGYQDRFGNPKPNAHLLGLFHRICKLLYYKIKPVFVFDGGVPMLKKDTIALRRKQKSIAKNKAQQMRMELINNLIKHSAVKTVLSTEKEDATSGPSELMVNLQSKRTADDMFKLPAIPSTSKAVSDAGDDYNSADSTDESSPRKQRKWTGNIHNVNVSTAEFKALPADVRYEILTDLKDTRKQNSWGRLHEMPEESNKFSDFQMKRLLKRRMVQQSLESAEKEMGGKTLTLDELDKLLMEQGITTNVPNCAFRVATDNTTRLIYISDKNEYMKNCNGNSGGDGVANNKNQVGEPVAGPSGVTPILDDINEYEFSDEWNSDIDTTAVNDFIFSKVLSSNAESEVESIESRTLSRQNFGKNCTNPALSYMLEYSGLSEKQIIAFLEQNKMETHKDYEKISRISEESDTTKTHDSNSRLTQDDKRTAIESVDTVKSARSFESMKMEVPNNAQIEQQDVIKVSTTETDSDDFIEIRDASASKENADVDKCALRPTIQVTFRSDENMKDDMFADIFEQQDGEADKEIMNLENSAFTDQLPTQSPRLNEVLPSEKLSTPSEDVANGKEPHAASKLKVISVMPVLKSTLQNEDVKLQFKKNGIENADSVENVDNGPVDCRSRVVDVGINTNRLEESNETTRVSPMPIPVNEEDLESMQMELENRQTKLMANIGKLERQGIDISDQIRSEAQELLRLFGIPYVVAPMEAEAQCAYLEQIHLTDGTITDDSDIWLFGGQCVYKNFFDNNRKVFEFRSCDIQRHFKLTRNDMIRLALLVGSDYTTGLQGVGPVTALEILGAFPSQSEDLLQGLINFCSWVESGRAAGPRRASLRNKLQNLQIQKGFPSQAVVQAYLFPKVDESKEPFTWGKFSNTLLSDYTKQKFGWDRDKYSQIMAPVLKRLEEKKTQSTIETYFKLQTVPKSIEVNLSKRVQKAVQRLKNENAEDSANTEGSAAAPVKKKKMTDDSQRKKKETKEEQKSLGKSSKYAISSISGARNKNSTVDECIPQREKDKANALKKRLHAIEIVRKSKQGLYKSSKVKRCVRKVKEEAELSESDSSDS